MMVLMDRDMVCIRLTKFYSLQSPSAVITQAYVAQLWPITWPQIPDYALVVTGIMNLMELHLSLTVYPSHQEHRKRQGQKSSKQLFKYSSRPTA